MATNERLTQLVQEVLSGGTEDLRLTQLCVEVLSASANQRVRATQVCVEVLVQSPANPVLRVTQAGMESLQQQVATSQISQTGAEALQQLGEVRVSQLGMQTAQQRGEVFVTQIGLEILTQPPTRGEGPGADVSCPEFFTDSGGIGACPVTFPVDPGTPED